VLAFLLSFKLLPSFSRFVVCLQTCFSFFLSFFFLSERESSEGLHRTSSEEVEIVILEEKKLPLRQSFFLFFFFFLRWAGSVCFCCSIGFFLLLLWRTLSLNKSRLQSRRSCLETDVTDVLFFFLVCSTIMIMMQ